MQIKFRSFSGNRSFAFVLMLMVLFTSAIVPRGYMIAPSSTQLFDVTLCPATNPLARAALSQENNHADHQHAHSQEHALHVALGHIDADGEVDAQAADQSSGDCAFAGLAAPALPLDGQVWDFDRLTETAQISVFHEARISIWHWRLRPPLRGPPLTA